ncbi:rhamnan synthesis F family protein [Vibrio sp. 10N]|uniref:rhamnan synthesis F family protein n=1 Tax=Vibrio sp. 10N TaxID=3058938 RepID=UPI002812A909|nr:hypothetical protein VB10N_29200 [Vibrio sp. 10N]
MNYRAMVKHKLPLAEKLLRKNPMLMRLAVRTESHLIKRQLKKQTKQLQGTVAALSTDQIELLQDAKKQGMFDRKWYEDVQQRVFNSELEAFGDYLSKSRFCGVSPSPAFDNLHYLKANTDVYHSGLPPLAHYLATGSHEGRASRPFLPNWTPTDKLTTPIDIKAIESLNIALCLHVFYDDFLDYYLECLKTFPTKVDVFVSVTSEASKKLAETKLNQCDNVKKLEVAIVPNHGRNFGPLLVEFAEQLMRYDLFAHLHSKKSLYSGRQQTQWADYLGEFLLKDSHRVAQMLTYFAQNKDCGIYYPTSFFMMPDWVNHWLKNKPFKQRFFEEWQIEHHDDFLAYPVGGMFWARPSALKPLLDKTYQYDDFPAEPLPNDGSELHALERCIGLLAEKTGHKQLFYVPELGSFTHDKSFVFSNYVNTKQQLMDKVRPFDIISFDVFDTLVRRSHFVPDYAKLKFGQQLEKEGLVASAHEFVKLRNNAEFEVRKETNFQGDVNIFQVYEKLGQHFDWSAEQAQQYAEVEFGHDLAMIESKDEIVDILNTLIGAGKTVYIISDTYYSEHQIVLMLRKAGVTNGYQLYVSSEMGLRKDNGSMWSYMQGHLKNKGSFVHIGDNAVADAQIPGDFGLANLHILNPLDKWQAAGFDNPLVGKDELNERLIAKWGPMISSFGRYPFFGE